MQDLSVYDTNNLAYILHMDSLDMNRMEGNSGDSQKTEEEEAPAGTGTSFLSTEDALLNTQVVRRRTSPRKRLSLNLSNLPPPVINLSVEKPSSRHRRMNRLSLPQRLMDLEIDVNATNHPSGEPVTRPPVKPLTRSLASPSARCPRTKKNIPIVASAASQEYTVPSSAYDSTSIGNNSSASASKTEPMKLRHKSVQPVMTESLEKAVAAVKLRPKSPQRDAQRRSNADFRLSFEMSI